MKLLYPLKFEILEELFEAYNVADVPSVLTHYH